MLVSFYLTKNTNDIQVLKKLCSKYLYTKFLIISNEIDLTHTLPFFLDNYSSEFFFNVKKKKKRLGFLFKRKFGGFLKADIFIYRHSKLNLIYFFSLRFKIYIKKKLFFSLNTLKHSIDHLQLVYIYKTIRGGFLGFSNNIFGFLSKKTYFKLKKKIFNILFYKNYFILLNTLKCLPYSLTNFSTFIFHKVGFIRNFAKIKKKPTLRLFFFKRFKLILTSEYFLLRKNLLFFKLNLKKILKYNSILVFYFILFRFYSLLRSNLL